MNPLLDWFQSLNLRALNARSTEHHHRITILEERMATIDEIVTRLRVATDNLAAKLRRLSEGDPRFEPLITELEAMGADPTDPVPTPVPEQPGTPGGGA